MTPKQIERIQTKIKSIRATLAAEKRKYGTYDDSRGQRYAPPGLYIQIEDYPGGLRYLQWFQENFPDDRGYPDFLFEWTLFLFKARKIDAAEKKAFDTFCANTYLFDKFFGNPIVPIDKLEWSNLCKPSFTDHFKYSSTQPGFADFTQWLSGVIASERFQTFSNQYIDIHKKLKGENDQEIRMQLIREARALEAGF